MLCYIPRSLLETGLLNDWANIWLFVKSGASNSPTSRYCFEKAILVEKCVAITLRCLATCVEHHMIGHLFGITRSTVYIIVHQTINAIVKTLLQVYIKFPTGQSLKNLVKHFEEKWHFPQCAHIPIHSHALNHTDYYNRKGFYSVVLQAVIDANYLFQEVYVGWPDSVHDTCVFVNLSLYQKANNDEILQRNI